MKMVLRQLFVGRGDKHIELHCQLIFNIETRLKSIESKTARKHVYKTDRNLKKNLQMNKTNFDPYSLTRPTETSFYENEKFMAKLDF